MPNRLKRARENDRGGDAIVFKQLKVVRWLKSKTNSLSLLSAQEARTLLQEEEKLMDRVDTDVDYNMEGNSGNFWDSNFSRSQNE